MEGNPDYIINVQTHQATCGSGADQATEGTWPVSQRARRAAGGREGEVLVSSRREKGQLKELKDAVDTSCSSFASCSFELFEDLSRKACRRSCCLCCPSFPLANPTVMSDKAENPPSTPPPASQASTPPSANAQDSKSPATESIRSPPATEEAGTPKSTAPKVVRVSISNSLGRSQASCPKC